MTESKGSPPVVYIVHGDDRHEQDQFVEILKENLGDRATAQMNTDHLDGRSVNLNRVADLCLSIPFLTSRRLVVLDHALRLAVDPGGQHKQKREKFLALLDKIPPTTALVMREYSSLTHDDRGRQLRSTHWLIRWAKDQDGRIYIKEADIPKGAQLVRWIQDQAQEKGGRFEPAAAKLLGELIGARTQTAAQEIEKLLVYVNFKRPVEVDDVVELCDYLMPAGNYFEMVDSLAQKQVGKVSRQINLLKEEQDPVQMFWGIVSHFRRLLLSREVIDQGGDEQAVAKALKVHPYFAKNLTRQAHGFTLIELENIYKTLHEFDAGIKTGVHDYPQALDLFIFSFSR